MGVINRVVRKQPFIIKKLYYNIVPFRYRYGKEFRDTFNFLKEVERWDYALAKEYQLEKLREVLIYARDAVPYYGKLFALHQFDPYIQSIDDLKSLPYLTKDIIQDNKQDLISTSFNGNPITFKTSGSTGKRLEFLGDDSMYKQEAAYIAFSFDAHGSNLYDDWSVWIRRHSPKDHTDMVVVDYELKRLYMSAFHLNDVTIFEYVKNINNAKVKTLVTYPSTAFWLACLLEKHNLKLPSIRSIHGASEKCLPEWESKIKKVFGFDLKMHYGQIEKVSFAYQSSQHEEYHESLTYSFTELTDDNIIVGTSFMNKVMPFIRYKTDDVVTPLVPQNLSYSSPLTIKEIDGRVDDMLLNETNCRIPSVNFYTVMSKFEDIKMFQFYQHRNKDVTLKIVPMDNFKDITMTQLRNAVIQRIGNLKLDIIVVDEIKRDSITGKLRCVITEIK